MVSAVGVPRCSWSRTISDSAAAVAEETRFGSTRVPRFKRIEVGNSKRTSFAKALSLLEGEREVVMRTRGSTIPDRCAYSSSSASSSSVVRSARD